MRWLIDLVTEIWQYYSCWKRTGHSDYTQQQWKHRGKLTTKRECNQCGWVSYSHYYITPRRRE